MRFDNAGMFWEDLVQESSRGQIIRNQPPIPETGWTTPNSFPRLDSASCISLDTETYDPDLLTRGPGWARGVGHIVGVSIGVEDAAWYFPIRHTIRPETNMLPEAVFAWLKDTLRNPKQPKIGANLMYDVGWLGEEGVDVLGPLYDVQFAEALLDERSEVSLEVLAQKYLGIGKETELVYQWCSDFYGGAVGGGQRANLWRAPASLVGPYACSDATLPLKVLAKQWPLLEKEGLLELFHMECELIPLLLAMRREGVHVNIPQAEQVREALRVKEALEVEKLEKLVGFEVNINAGDSIAKAFDSLGYPYGKTSTGKPSFTKDFLVSVDNPVSQAILEVRKCSKLRGTFIESYILDSNINGKVYGQFHPLRGDSGGTRSGRLSSCLPEDTLILTNAGEKELKEIESGDKVLTHTGRFCSVVQKWLTGTRKTYKISLECGKELVCTSNHRLMTSHGWLSLEDLYGHQQKLDNGFGSYQKRFESLFSEGEANYFRDSSAASNHIPNSQPYSKEQPFEGRIRKGESSSLFAEQNWCQESDARKVWGSAPQLQGGMRWKEWLFNYLEAKMVYWVAKSEPRSSSSSRFLRSHKNYLYSKRFCGSPYRWRHNQQPYRQFGVAYHGGASHSTPQYSRIKKVNYVGMAPVFDLEVEEDHCFVANGIYVHNSTPNLQNIPSRDEELAPLIRGIFDPDPGHETWRRYDYSQIEYRFMIHFATGPGAEEARRKFNEEPDTDYHEMTLDLIAPVAGWDISTAEKRKVKRKPTKNINFGLIYGMGVEKLSHDLGLSKKEGTALFAAYHKGVQFARPTMDAAMAEAAQLGTISTILGRKSRFDLWEPLSWGKESLALPYDKAIKVYGGIRRAYTHKALNRRLQGSAADLMKRAMWKCWTDGVFERTGVPRLTVHDELDFSDPGGREDAFSEMKHILETAIELKIPVRADEEIGPDWGHTKGSK